MKLRATEVGKVNRPSLENLLRMQFVAGKNALQYAPDLRKKSNSANSDWMSDTNTVRSPL
jgi:hypothetical protein